MHMVASSCYRLNGEYKFNCGHKDHADNINGCPSSLLLIFSMTTPSRHSTVLWLETIMEKYVFRRPSVSVSNSPKRQTQQNLMLVCTYDIDYITVISSNI